MLTVHEPGSTLSLAFKIPTRHEPSPHQRFQRLRRSFGRQ